MYGALHATLYDRHSGLRYATVVRNPLTIEKLIKLPVKRARRA